MAKLKELVLWLEMSPLYLNPLDLTASLDVRGTKIEIRAPRVNTSRPIPPVQG